MRTLLLFLLCTLPLSAQDYAWVRQVGGDGRDIAGDIAVDAAGNSYVSGTFASTITFGGTTHTSIGGKDIFLAKYSPTGQVVWSIRAGGAGDDAASGVAISHDGALYISGLFQSSATIGTTTLNGEGAAPERDGFIARFTSDGAFVWARKIGSFSAQGEPVIAVDPSGALFLAANFSGSVTIAGNTFTTRPNSLRDIFLARYSSAGDPEWARHIQAYRASTIKAIDAGAEGVYLSGTYVDTLVIGTTMLPRTYFEDLFVGHYSASGDFRWARAAQGKYFEASGGITVDGKGNSYIAGSFTDTVRIDTSTLAGRRNGGTDIFLAKLDRSGRVLWLKGGIGRFGDVAFDVESDSLGNFFMTGTFSDSIVFDRMTLKTPPGSAAGVFAARFLSTGELDWAEVNRGAAMMAWKIALDPERNLMMAGMFGGTLGLRGFPMESADSADLFVAKMVRTTPGSPRQITPPNESEYILLSSPFRWRPVPEATRYELQVAPDSTFTLGMLSHFTTRSTTTLPFLQDSSKYYWRVRGYIGERPGAWSKILWFRTREQYLVNDFRWVDTTRAIVQDIATDKAGYSYAIGIQSTSSIDTTGGREIRLVDGSHYVAKFDPSGFSHWATEISGTIVTDKPPKICLDSSGAIYIACDINGPRTIGGKSVPYTGGSSSSSFYLAKLKGEGAVEWAVAPTVANTGLSRAIMRGIAADRLGNVYVTGIAHGSVSFGPHTISGTGSAGMIFVAKYSPAGVPLWAIASRGDLFVFENGIAVDPEGNIFIGGEFMRLLELGSVTLRDTHLDDPTNYIIRIRTDGTVLWGQTAGAGGDLGQFGGIAVDAAGNGFLAGNYTDYATFGFPGGKIDTLLSAGVGPMFLAKYKPDGTVLWARAMGSSITRAKYLAVDAEGSAYMTGIWSFYANFTVGSGPRRNDNGYSLFVKKVTPDGFTSWVATASGYTDTTGIRPAGIGVDAEGNAYVGGLWWGSPHFGIIKPAPSRNGGGFVAKIGDQSSDPYTTISPENGSVDQPRSLLLVWAPVAGAIGYELEVSERPDFSTTFRQERELTTTEYLLTGLALDRQYYWRVRANMGAAKLGWSESWRFRTAFRDSTSSVRPEIERESRGALDLVAAPNPFPTETALSFTMPAAGDLHVELFDRLGRSVGVPFSGRAQAGVHALDIDATTLSAGLYYCRVRAAGVVETIELIVE